MKYCGLNYIQSAITLEDAKMRNLSKALYEYYRQAYLYVNNIVLVRGYQIIDDSIYYYGNDGNIVKDTTVDGYTFGSDGKLVANNKFVTVNGNTYYLVNNKIVHGYRVVGNYIYYFGEDGAMVVSTTVDGYTFGADGKLVGNGIYVTVRGKKYYMKSNKAYLTANVFGTVTESDNDADYSNNDTLRNVKCTAVTNAGTFTCYSDSYGEFDFGDLPLAGASIKFELSGYITATLTSDINVTPLRIVMDKEVSNKLSGKIFIADSDTDYTNNSPLSGAKITLERETSTNIFVKTATSDSNGNYYFEGLTAGVYKLTVEKSGYITVSQTVNVRYNESNIQNLAIEAIADTQVADGYASGYVTDAKTGSKIQGITVYIREGINNTTGNVLCTSTTNSSGLYKTVALAPGNYTAQFVDNRPLSDEDNRYGTVSIAIKVLSNITVANQNSTMSNNAGISAAGMQVVLTWGSNPSDLDSHLFAKLADGSSYHIYYSHKVESDANLDVDDTSYYGPETVTVSDFSNGIYSYYVHDYSNRGNSYNTVLSNSGATVKVYIDSANTPSYTFYVPQGSGTYWHVFDYNYTTGEFIPVNRITNSAS